MARRNYRPELLAVCTWPVTAAMFEGAVTGILAKKAFDDTPDWIIATLAAAPAFCNMSSLIWARLANGRRTLHNLLMLQLGVVALVACIALLPRTEAGLYLFTLLAVGARLLMTGVITLRAVLWRANYRRHERGAITGRLILIQTMLVSLTALLLGAVMDIDRDSFHFVYGAAVFFGLAGVWFFSRLRLRHPFLIRPSLAPREHPPGGALAGLLAEWGGTLNEMIVIMRSDAAYRGFMVCMFILGISNLALDGPLIKVVDEQFHLSYLGSLLLLNSLPLALMPVFIPIWSRLLGRCHIIRYRAIHGWTFVIAQFLVFAAVMNDSIALLTAGLAVRGVGVAGGELAWNLGHNDFASSERASTYMTIHVTLTGVRGLISGYVGMWLYAGFPTTHGVVPLLGEYAFLFWAIICTLGALGFVYLNFRLAHLTRRGPQEQR
ncbi:MAG: hypothetical protein IT430_07600 [Phycisphaerales bacterium]|nr:hypothetical protein [Phycisphaerales bacterium]